MKLPLYQIDAFTSRLFGGNPAAVVTLDEWLADDVLQAIASENNLAETAFLIPREDMALLRWFTPTVEVDLCGHATLAAAHVLFSYHYSSPQTVSFSTRSGVLSVSREEGRLSLDLPARPGTPIEVSDELVSALGARPREAYLARDILAVFDTEVAIQSLHPNFGLVATLDAFAGHRVRPRQHDRFRISLFCATRWDSRRSGHRLGALHVGAVLGGPSGKGDTHGEAVVASRR